MKYELPTWYDQLMKKYPIVTHEEWQVLDSIATVKRIKKGDAFLRSGKVARNAAFVISGSSSFLFLMKQGMRKLSSSHLRTISWPIVKVIIRRHLPT